MDSQEKRYETMAQVIERVKELAQCEETPEKEEVEMLKSLFYKFHIQEREQQLKNYLEAGGDPEKYVIQPDTAEADFKAEMAIIRERRQKLFKEQEAEKLENLKRKQWSVQIKSTGQNIDHIVLSPEDSFGFFPLTQARFTPCQLSPKLPNRRGKGSPNHILKEPQPSPDSKASVEGRRGGYRTELAKHWGRGAVATI